jgi:hypothetical protein
VMGIRSAKPASSAIRLDDNHIRTVMKSKHTLADDVKQTDLFRDLLCASVSLWLVFHHGDTETQRKIDHKQDLFFDRLLVWY